MDTIPFCDELMTCYYELAGRSEIANTQEYADEWLALAVDMATAERPGMAESCSGRYRQYTKFAEYFPSAVRIVEGNGNLRWEQVSARQSAVPHLGV